MKTKSQSSILLLFVLGLFFSTCRNSEEQAQSDNDVQPDTLALLSQHTKDVDSILTGLQNLNKARFGDFDTLFKRRMIRVLIPYSRSLFFYDKGRERGISAETFRDFELYLNRKYKIKRKNIPITIIIIPTPRDLLLSQLNAGMGDIAAGNLTVTEKRLEQVDFFIDDDKFELLELPLTRGANDSLTSVEQLAGRTIHLRKSSSYFEHLLALNKQFASKKKLPMRLVTVSEDLEDEDLMEMLDAGILSTIIVDRWKARMWTKVLPSLNMNERAAVHSDGHLGWGIRKNSPVLLKELSDFYLKYEVRNGMIPYRLDKYASQIEQLQDPTKSANIEQYKKILQYFEKYGKMYDFDPLMLVALGFQESKLNQKEVSPVGAVGIMQLMPKTGASMKVGSIYVMESNIHAGTKYLNILMTDHFKDAKFDTFNRSLFAFASYNAGPTRVAELRQLARKRGLDPDLWLNNVEIIASEKIGQETTTYVRNIMKYYYSYKMIQEIQK